MIMAKEFDFGWVSTIAIVLAVVAIAFSVSGNDVVVQGSEQTNTLSASGSAELSIEQTKQISS